MAEFGKTQAAGPPPAVSTQRGGFPGMPRGVEPPPITAAGTVQWERIDRCFDAYSAATVRLVEMIGGRSDTDSNLRVEKHILVTDNLLNSLCDWAEQRLDESNKATIQRLRQTASVHQLTAPSAIQRLCLAHLTMCEVLATVGSASADGEDAELTVDEYRRRVWSNGLEQLRWLLYCELRLWANMAKADP
jgi:hypothetical protein